MSLCAYHLEVDVSLCAYHLEVAHLLQVWDLKGWNTPVMTLKSASTAVTHLSLASRRGQMAAVLDDATTRVYRSCHHASLHLLSVRLCACDAGK